MRLMSYAVLFGAGWLYVGIIEYLYHRFLLHSGHHAVHNAHHEAFFTHAYDDGRLLNHWAFVAVLLHLIAFFALLPRSVANFVAVHAHLPRGVRVGSRLDPRSSQVVVRALAHRPSSKPAPQLQRLPANLGLLARDSTSLSGARRLAPSRLTCLNPSRVRGAAWAAKASALLLGE